jgi:signal transduction histidine kinase
MICCQEKNGFTHQRRIEPERSSETGGVGLCLAIAHHVVEINGCQIELENILGQGSTFRIVLPAQKEAETA